MGLAAPDGMEELIMSQSLQCAIKAADCDSTAEYVCHECGKPLCGGENCCQWGWDPAFAGNVWHLFSLPPITYHCPQCDHLHGVFKVMRRGINWLHKHLD